MVAKKNLFIHIPQQRRLCRWDSSRGRSWGLLLLVAAVVSSHLLMTSSKTCQAATNDQQRHTVVAFSETLGGPPTRLISWFINSVHTIVVSITHHTCWSCVHQLSYRKRGPHFVVVENQINGWSPYSPLKWRFFLGYTIFSDTPVMARYLQFWKKKRSRNVRFCWWSQQRIWSKIGYPSLACLIISCTIGMVIVRSMSINPLRKVGTRIFSESPSGEGVDINM